MRRIFFRNKITIVNSGFGRRAPREASGGATPRERVCRLVGGRRSVRRRRRIFFETHKPVRVSIAKLKS